MPGQHPCMCKFCPQSIGGPGLQPRAGVLLGVLTGVPGGLGGSARRAKSGGPITRIGDPEEAGAEAAERAG